MHKLFGGFILLLIGLLPLQGQNFEGVIKMEQEGEAGMRYQLNWYIKKDQIAFEVQTKSDPNSLKMRFVPQPQKNSMLMVIQSEEGQSKKEISSRDIQADLGLSNAVIKSEKVRKSVEFGQLYTLNIETDKFNTEVELVKEIDVDLKKYAAYLKNDYGIQALIQTGEKGFPLNSTTYDKYGKLISKTKVLSIVRQKVDDKYFQ